jgi:hypothetical protein
MQVKAAHDLQHAPPQGHRQGRGYRIAATVKYKFPAHGLNL